MKSRSTGGSLRWKATSTSSSKSKTRASPRVTGELARSRVISAGARTRLRRSRDPPDRRRGRCAPAPGLSHHHDRGRAVMGSASMGSITKARTRDRDAGEAGGILNSSRAAGVRSGARNRSDRGRAARRQIGSARAEASASFCKYWSSHGFFPVRRHPDRARDARGRDRWRRGRRAGALCLADAGPARFPQPGRLRPARRFRGLRSRRPPDR